MKLDTGKHNHKLTDLLKFGLFSLVMLAPIGSIAVKCAYVICNKNAYESYYGETINEETITYVDNLENGKEYFLTLPMSNLNVHNTNGGDKTSYVQVSNVEVINNNSQYNFEEVNYISFYSSSNALTFNIYFSNNLTDTYLFSFSNSTQNGFTLKFNLLNKSSYLEQFIVDNDIFYQKTYNKFSYLDNVFEYSIANIENNTMYNWTANTGVYEGVNAMTTGLGIQSRAIPIILTYWFLITVIYVIIDIVIWGFTTMTHLLQKKA